MSRLRLAAACALLKLAQEPCYHEIITLEQYQLCALVINVRTTCQFIFSVLLLFTGLIFSTLLAHFPEPFHRPCLLSNYPLHFLCIFIFAVRTSATRCGSVSPRNSTGAYVASGCRWNIWLCLLCVPRTLLKRGGLTLASAW